MSKNHKAAARGQDNEAAAALERDEAKAPQSSPIKMAVLVFGLPFVLLVVMALLMRQS